uniref:TetR/AcrR family transcriptional regulator n=1 Tax=Anaerosporobacter sp. TaxID=1872529 RepID=UPI00286F793E
ENKKDAIFSATIRMINEVGYANVSMSKIAKVAGVSASTLYTYYENKEDMFRKVYVEAKKLMLSAGSKGINESETVKQSAKRFCSNVIKFLQEEKEYFLFIDQSSSSPLISEAMYEDINVQNQKIFLAFERGVKEGVLKNAPVDLLIGFCFYPITQIYKESCHPQALTKDIDYELVFNMCWDAIKK